MGAEQGQARSPTRSACSTSSGARGAYRAASSSALRSASIPDPAKSNPNPISGAATDATAREQRRSGCGGGAADPRADPANVAYALFLRPRTTASRIWRITTHSATDHPSGTCHSGNPHAAVPAPTASTGHSPATMAEPACGLPAAVPAATSEHVPWSGPTSPASVSR